MEGNAIMEDSPVEADLKVVDSYLIEVLALIKGGRRVRHNCHQVGALKVSEDDFIRYALTSETTFAEVRNNAPITTLARMLEWEENNQRRKTMMKMLTIAVCDSVKKEKLRRIHLWTVEKDGRARKRKIEASRLSAKRRRADLLQERGPRNPAAASPETPAQDTTPENAELS